MKTGSDVCGYTANPPDSLLLSPTATKIAAPAPPPAPTASVFVIWQVPPVTGEVHYNFYNVEAGFKDSLDTQYGARAPPVSPFFEAKNPHLDRADKIRVGGQSAVHEAPGSLGPFIGMKGNYKYVEDKLGEAEVRCDGNVVRKCSVPDHGLTMDIKPDNGR